MVRFSIFCLLFLPLQFMFVAKVFVKSLAIILQTLSLVVMPPERPRYEIYREPIEDITVISPEDMWQFFYKHMKLGTLIQFGALNSALNCSPEHLIVVVWDTGHHDICLFFNIMKQDATCGSHITKKKKHIWKNKTVKDNPDNPWLVSYRNYFLSTELHSSAISPRSRKCAFTKLADNIAQPTNVYILRNQELEPLVHW